MENNEKVGIIGDDATKKCLTEFLAANKNVEIDFSSVSEAELKDFKFSASETGAISRIPETLERFKRFEFATSTVGGRQSTYLVAVFANGSVSVSRLVQNLPIKSRSGKYNCYELNDNLDEEITEDKLTTNHAHAMSLDTIERIRSVEGPKWNNKLEVLKNLTKNMSLTGFTKERLDYYVKTNKKEGDELGNGQQAWIDGYARIFRMRVQPFSIVPKNNN